LSASAELFIPSSELVAYTHVPGEDKMRSGADLWGGSPLVSFNHVTDPHCHFLQQIRNPNPNPNFDHWSADRQFSPFRSAPQIRPAPYFTLTIYTLLFALSFIKSCTRKPATTCQPITGRALWDTYASCTDIFHKYMSYYFHIYVKRMSMHVNNVSCVSMYVASYDDYEAVYVHIICH